MYEKNKKHYDRTHHLNKQVCYLCNKEFFSNKNDKFCSLYCIIKAIFNPILLLISLYFFIFFIMYIVNPNSVPTMRVRVPGATHYPIYFPTIIDFPIIFDIYLFFYILVEDVTNILFIIATFPFIAISFSNVLKLKRGRYQAIITNTYNNKPKQYSQN